MDLAEVQRSVLETANAVYTKSKSEDNYTIYKAIVDGITHLGFGITKLPICIFSVLAGEVQVIHYPNIPTRTTSLRANAHRLDEEQLIKAINHNNRQWTDGETAARGLDRIVRTEVISLSALIAIMCEGVAGNKIDEIARHVIATSGIIKNVPIISKDKEEMRAVYREAKFNSCMGGESPTWKKLDTYPVDWYYYSPDAYLYYLRGDNGKVVFRCILHKKDDKWWHNNIYGDYVAAKHHLRVLGASELYYYGRDTLKPREFQIKGVMTDGKYYAPNPSFDNYPYHKFVAFKDGVFYYSNTKRDGLKWTGLQGLAVGYISEDFCNESVCAQCGTRIAAGQAHIHTEDNVKYCTSGCASFCGYVKMYNIAGNFVYSKVVNHPEHVKDCVANDIYYTTLAAAKACGALPYITGIDLMVPENYDEGAIVTQSIKCYTVTYDGPQYKMDAALFNKLWLEKRIDADNVIKLVRDPVRVKCVLLDELVIETD